MSLLNNKEEEILNLLADAWNAFIKLEKIHPSEQKEFQTAIHDAQKTVMVRPVLRENKRKIR